MGARRRDEGSGKEAEKMKAEEQREAGQQAEEGAAGAGRWRRQVRGWRAARKPLEVVTEVEHATPPIPVTHLHSGTVSQRLWSCKACLDFLHGWRQYGYSGSEY